MAYTEYYCQSGGSNLNAGSTTNNTAAYTSAAGNWVQSTRVFTPTDGSNPSASVSVGDWGSVYITAGATNAVWIARISAVQNATNGTITFVLTATFAGATPANGTGTMTIRVGGAWLGPNAATGFPFTLTSFGNNQDASSNMVRMNLKNDQTYSLTAAFTPTNSGNKYAVRGYTSSVGDGGKATFDGGTSTGSILSATGPLQTVWEDVIFTTSITTGTSDLVTEGTQSGIWIRCVFQGSRGGGISMNATSTPGAAFECEAYNNNRSNTAGKAGFQVSGAHLLYRCISHDNTGSNSAGFVIAGGGTTLQNCISDTNGGRGVNVTSTSSFGPIVISACDIYNNGGDGITIASANVTAFLIENTNFIKNTGAAINNASTTDAYGYIFNCGYGAGTQANGSADTLGRLEQSGTVTYASNVTPWVDPANGDFRINLTAANFAGRQAFTQTAASYAGTVGYPDIGAAQSATGGGSGTFTKEVSYGYAS